MRAYGRAIAIAAASLCALSARGEAVASGDVRVELDIDTASAIGERVASELSVVADAVGAALDDIDVSVEVVESAPHVVNIARNVGWWPGRVEGSETLVVRAGDEDMPALDDTLADVAVLARIVSMLADPGDDWDTHATVQSMVLQGHGLVFLMSAPFPLAAPSEPGDGTRETDALWQETMREMWGADPEPSRREYDPAQVDTLTEALKEALAYARNVRGLPARGRVGVIVTESDPMRPGSAWPTPEFSISVQDRLMKAYTWSDDQQSRARYMDRAPSRLVVSAPVSAVNESVTNGDAFAAAVEADVARSGDTDMRQDLAVLSGVLATALRRHAGEAPSGASYSDDYAFHTYRSTNSARGARYIDGYGVIARAATGVALVAPAEDESDAPPSDGSLWESTQREMRADGRATPRWRPTGRGGSATYDEGKVRDVRAALVDTLREASNVRGLSPTESVVIVIRGDGPPGTTSVAGYGIAAEPAYAILAGTSAGGGATMTAHATKRDIDEFAEAAITRDEFVQRVTFHTAVARRAGRVVRMGQRALVAPAIPVPPTPPAAPDHGGISPGGLGR